MFLLGASELGKGLTTSYIHFILLYYFGAINWELLEKKILNPLQMGTHCYLCLCIVVLCLFWTFY